MPPRRDLPAPAFQVRQIAAHQLATRSSRQLDADWDLTAFFGHIYVIIGSEDRREIQRQQLASVGLQEGQVETIQGVESGRIPPAVWRRMVVWDRSPRDRQGQAACLLAHYRVIADAFRNFERARRDFLGAHTLAGRLEAEQRLRQYETVVVFEDNNAFGRLSRDGRTASLQGEGRRLRQVLAGLPPDWDWFYFMSMKRREGDVMAAAGTEHLKRIRYGLVTKAYAVHSRMYRPILSLLSRLLSNQTPRQSVQPVDHEFARLHRRSLAYVASPALTYRYKSPSLVRPQDAPIESGRSHWQSDV